MPQDLVLDTNVVLDWTLFDDPGVQALGAALAAGRMRWIATPAMYREFLQVVDSGRLARWRPDPAALRSHWHRHCSQLPEPAPAKPGMRLRCSDPDDQMFIDLAASRPGCVLLSRDRAVLKLARRLATLKVTLTTPAGWVAATASRTDAAFVEAVKRRQAPNA